MRTENALGPFDTSSGGGDGVEGAGENEWPMEVMGRAALFGVLLDARGESRQLLMWFWITYHRQSVIETA
jgi:hypothetical protein